MATITIDSAKAQVKSAKQPAETVQQPPVFEDPLGAGDAQHFVGQPLVLFARLERAMSELTFYRVSLRHRNERETSDVREHDEWKRAAAALARELADEIEAGALDPNAEAQKKLAVAQALIEEAMKAQRGA